MPADSLPSTERPLSVWMVASEVLPFSKTGGLADVLGALPQALSRLGWHVTIVTPRYGHLEPAATRSVPLGIGGHHLLLGFRQVHVAPGVRVILVDEPSLFDREGLYGPPGGEFPDNPRRFAVLARAALELMAGEDTPPDVVHIHDWQAGLVPVYLRTLYAGHPRLSQLPVVLTIHNLAYQGVCAPDWLPRLDLPWSMLDIRLLEFWGQISFLKGAVGASRLVTTVSPTYAREIQTQEGGVGFDGIVRARRDDLVGVLNGIDAHEWNPATDRHLPAPFSMNDLSGKRLAKRGLLTRYGLRADAEALGRPLVAMISRMVDQKGLDIISAAGDALANLGAAFVILGTGEGRYEDFWRGMAQRHPETVGVRVGFDESLAHLIEAGADIFMMPSRFEPCGLNQMYSLRYGTIPVVRPVGGLADTVVAYGGGRADANGFVVAQHTSAALLSTLTTALQVFGRQPEWHKLQQTGMSLDLSWDRSAREYVKIYERALTKGETEWPR